MEPTTTTTTSAAIATTDVAAAAAAAAAADTVAPPLAELIDGKAIAAAIREEIRVQVQLLAQHPDTPVIPGLAVLLVGSRRDSQTYVQMKKKACAEVGMASFGYEYKETVTQDELLQQIAQLNQDARVHGILVQLPLPKHLDEATIVQAVDPRKDVDGLHPLNVAALAAMDTHHNHEGTSSSLNWHDLNSIPFPLACTPQGCMELLDRSHVELAGKRAVVVGRSNLVGLPVSLMLLHRNATVTIVHSKTRHAPEIVRQADVVIAAAGKAGLITADWLGPGSVVIDVGINSIEAPHSKKGFALVGDVDLPAARRVCAKVTPVPGGVGPMTIAMLLRNTLNACKRSMNNSETA